MQMQNYLNDQANYNADPLGNPNKDPRIVSEEFGLVGNEALPGNAIFANASSPGNNFLYNTGNPYKDNLYNEDGEYDPYGIKGEPEVKEIESARNGGVMGYGRG